MLKKIQAIFQSVKDLAPEQKNKIILSMLVKNPEGHLLSFKNMLLLNRQAALYNQNISFSAKSAYKLHTK